MIVVLWLILAVVVGYAASTKGRSSVLGVIVQRLA